MSLQVSTVKMTAELYTTMLTKQKNKEDNDAKLYQENIF